MSRTLRSLASIATLLTLSAPVFAQDKSAGSIVQLPSAGGTVTREEGTFGLNTNTGSANFRLPLPRAADPRRLRSADQRSPTTSSPATPAAGLGIGWGFGVPAIAINDDLGTAIPGTRPEGDFFSHLGFMGARLVFQGVDGGLWRYRPEFSETHVEVLYHPGPFEVVTLGPTGELVSQTIPSGFEMLNADGGRMIFSGDPAVAEGDFAGAAPFVTKWPLVLQLNADREAVRYAYEVHGGRSYLDQISFAGGRSVYDFELMDTQAKPRVARRPGHASRTRSSTPA